MAQTWGCAAFGEDSLTSKLRCVTSPSDLTRVCVCVCIHATWYNNHRPYRSFINQGIVFRQVAWAGFLKVAQLVKNLPTMQETQAQALGGEDPLEKRMAAHSSILVWKIPWTEEPGRLQSMEPQRAELNWATKPSPPPQPFWIRIWSLTRFPRWFICTLDKQWPTIITYLAVA